MAFSWRLRRQFFILALFAAIGLIIALIIIVPKLTRPPTCFDKSQNGGEHGVDCGGACSRQCTIDMVAPSIKWARAVPITGTIYTAVANVANQNRNAGLYNASYEFRLYDADNVFIAKKEGTISLAPNRETAIVEADIDVGTRVPKYTIFAFTSSLNWFLIDPRASDILLQPLDVALTNAGVRPKITARIKNPSLYDLGRVDVVALLYDDAGTLVAASKTYLDSLKAGATDDVFFFWPVPFAVNVRSIEIHPTVDIFTVALH